MATPRTPPLFTYFCFGTMPVAPVRMRSPGLNWSPSFLQSHSCDATNLTTCLPVLKDLSLSCTDHPTSHACIDYHTVIILSMLTRICSCDMLFLSSKDRRRFISPAEGQKSDIFLLMRPKHCFGGTRANHAEQCELMKSSAAASNFGYLLLVFGR